MEVIRGVRTGEEQERGWLARGRSSSRRLGAGGQLGLSLGLSQGFIFSGFLPDGWKHPAYCSPGRWGGPQAAPASQVSHFPLAQSRLGPPICEGPSSPIIPKARPKQSSPVAQLSGINCQTSLLHQPVLFNLTLALGPQEPCPTSREFPPQAPP